MSRRRFASGTPWEEFVGYSRAVRTGPFVHVSGTTATDADGRIVGVGDPYAQTIRCLENIRHALTMAGASMSDVVRTRMYVTDIGHWEAVGRAHGEVFASVRPCSTLVAVAGLVDPDMLVEVEADAYAPGPRPDIVEE
jgi:enamine deaminase RidA (YjgF/YER057c/UK114 family)